MTILRFIYVLCISWAVAGATGWAHGESAPSKSAGQPMPASQPSDRPVILVLGDSLSAAHNIPESSGWVALLSERLQGQAEVVNASISGETTSGGVTRFPTLLQRHQPQFILIELGANDGLRGMPPTFIEDNLAKMLSLAQQANTEVLLLGIHLPSNYGPAYRQRFDAIYTSLACEYDVPLVPFLLHGVATDSALLQADGLHPTAGAQPQILDHVWPQIEQLIGEEVVGGARFCEAAEKKTPEQREYTRVNHERVTGEQRHAADH